MKELKTTLLRAIRTAALAAAGSLGAIELTGLVDISSLVNAYQVAGIIGLHAGVLHALINLGEGTYAKVAKH